MSEKICDEVAAVLDTDLRRLRKTNFVDFLKRYRAKEVMLEKEAKELKKERVIRNKNDPRNFKEL